MTELQVWIAMYLVMGAFVMRGTNGMNGAAWNKMFTVVAWPIGVIISLIVSVFE